MFQCKVPLDPGSSEQFYPAESSFYVAARLSRLRMLHPVQFPHVSKHSKCQRGSPGSPCAVPCASKNSTQQKLHSMRPKVTSSSLWCSRVAVEEEF